MECRDRASPERADRQSRRLSGHQLRDPDGFPADRRRPLSRSSSSVRMSTLDVIADNDAELAAKPEQIAAHERLVAAGGEGVRRAALRPLRLPADDLRLSRRRGARASPELRGRSRTAAISPTGTMRLRDRNLLPHEYHPQLERQVPPRAPTCGRPIIARRCRTTCCGSMKAARSSGATCSARARACCRSRTRSTQSPRPPRPTALGTPGRTWRPLVDTTNDPIIAQRSPQPWRSWQRSEDYYSEGQLIWIDVDRIIRQQSGGKRSIDDFAKAFFGMRDGDYGELTYTFDDVVATLNEVQPYDWRSYLQRKVYDIAPASRRSKASTRAATSWSTPTSRPTGSRAPRRAAQEHRPDLFGRVHRRQ